jgi:hypothetical protein
MRMSAGTTSPIHCFTVAGVRCMKNTSSPVMKKYPRRLRRSRQSIAVWRAATYIARS